MLNELTETITEHLDDAGDWIAVRTARAARGGAIIGGTVGAILAILLLAMGFIIGKVS